MRGVKPAADAIQAWPVAFRDALIVVGLSAMMAGAVNLARGESRLPFVQRDDYDILVPCPEPVGEVAAVAAGEAGLQEPRVLVVDARGAERYARWHVPGALSVPFDYLEPTGPELVRELASSGAKALVVYGDGGDPDSGEQLARELAGQGLRNVRFVAGGAPALVSLPDAGAASPAPSREGKEAP